MRFRPINKTRVYEQVIAQIRELIVAGRLKRGDRLPAERELTEQLQVSRASIREAFSALEMIGLIESRPREGTFIRSRATRNLLEPLSLVFLLDDQFPEDFIELRRILEIEAARLAALRATREEKDQLAASIERMERPFADEAQIIAADVDFHRTLLTAAHNSLLKTILDSLAEVIDLNIKDLRTRLFREPADRKKLNYQHREIFEAVFQGDTTASVNAMSRHYDFIAQVAAKHSR